MPFFQPVVHSDNFLGCGSLRVQRPKTKKEMEKNIYHDYSSAPSQEALR